MSNRNPSRHANFDIIFEAIYASPSIVQPGEMFDVFINASGDDLDKRHLDIEYHGSDDEGPETVYSENNVGGEVWDLYFQEIGQYQLRGAAAKQLNESRQSGVSRSGTFLVLSDDSKMVPDVTIQGPEATTIGEEVTFTVDASLGIGSITRKLWTGDILRPGDSITVSFDEPGEKSITAGVTGEIPTDHPEIQNLALDRPLVGTNTDSVTLVVKADIEKPG
jgi:hypothetical protein